ncbi:MAG: GTPase [Synergistales bacterium]
MNNPEENDGEAFCPGCGVQFQRENPDAPGFVPASLEIGNGTICRRCFRLVHYRQATKAPLSDDHVCRMIRDEMERADGAIVFVDAFQPDRNPALNGLLKGWGKPILTVINKFDMISEWFRSGTALRRLADILEIPKDHFITMNALDHASVKKATTWIERRFHPGARILLIGPVNSGKTTFLRSACTEAHRVLRSPMPGTTLRPVSISSAQLGMTLVDIPGFRSDDPWIPILCPECLVNLQPGKKPNRLTTSLKTGDSLLFGGLVSVEVLDIPRGDRVGIAAFTPERLVLHRTRADRVAELLDRHAGGLLKIPCPGCRRTLKEIPWSRSETPLSKGRDLVLPGCGWMTVWQGEALFSVHAPDFFGYRIRTALIGGDDVHEC